MAKANAASKSKILLFCEVHKTGSVLAVQVYSTVLLYGRGLAGFHHALANIDHDLLTKTACNISKYYINASCLILTRNNSGQYHSFILWTERIKQKSVKGFDEKACRKYQIAT